MRKFQKFFLKVAQIRSELKGNNLVYVKEVIGDSANNKRTLTVNQLIRYLSLGEVRGDKKLARQIKAVFPVLKSEIVGARRDLTQRTDAIDVTEFVNTYRHVVMNNKLYRRTVATKLSKVV